jgi:hypothetical protein
LASIKTVEPGIKQILTLLAPVLMGLGFLQFSEFFQDVVAWNLTTTADSSTLNI